MSSLHDKATCLAPPMDSLLWHDGQAMLAYILLTRTVHDLGWIWGRNYKHNWIAMDEDGDWFSFNLKPEHNEHTGNAWGVPSIETMSARYLVSMKVVTVHWEYALLRIKKPAGEGDSEAG